MHCILSLQATSDCRRLNDEIKYRMHRKYVSATRAQMQRDRTADLAVSADTGRPTD